MDFNDDDNVHGQSWNDRVHTKSYQASRFRERACRISAIPFHSREALEIPYAYTKFIPKGREERSSKRRGVRWPSSVINSRTIALKRESIKDYLPLSSSHCLSLSFSFAGNEMLSPPLAFHRTLVISKRGLFHSAQNNEHDSILGCLLTCISPGQRFARKGASFSIPFKWVSVGGRCERGRGFTANAKNNFLNRK